MTVKINIDNRTVVRVLAVIILFMLGLRFLDAISYPLTLVLIAAFLALALNPPVHYLSSRMTRGSRGLATAVAYVAVLAVIGVFMWTVVPPLYDETVKFLNDLPDYVDDISSGQGPINEFIDRYDLDDEVTNLGNDIAAQLGSSSGQIFAGISRVGSALISLLTVLVLTFFMLVEGPTWIDRFWQTQPEKTRAHRQELASRMYHVVTGYVNGQLLVALIAASTSLIAMLILGLRFALPLAGIVGMFGLIPLVGATLGSVIVITIAFFEIGLGGALFMFAFFVIYQQIENNFIVPYIQSRTLEVSPLLVLIAVLFGISIGGILGGFIAIPVAACGRILLNDYLEHRGGKVKA